jgi:threonine/homoserine/homoserine lactone efflux protein
VTPLVAGLLVGLGVVLPPIRVELLVHATAARKEAALGVVAAFAVAVMDTLYALLAAALGGVVAGATGPARSGLDVLAAGVLIGVAARQLLWRLLLGPTGIPPNAVLQDDPVRTFLQVLLIRALNPVALIVIGAAAIGTPEAVAGGSERVQFVGAIAGVALTWRLVLAAVGLAQRRIAAREQHTMTIVGAAMLVWLAIVVGSRPG